MKKIFLLSLLTLSLLDSIAQKHVGIGTTNPLAALHVADSSVLFTGPLILPVTATPPPVSGAGSRMFWYTDKAAFRAGGVGSTEWDNINIGQYSFAAGLNTKASGSYSTAMGYFTVATGPGSTAFGEQTTASGDGSTAAGYGTNASGSFSSALGIGAAATGYGSTALGKGTTASSDYSTAIGNGTNASGNTATAMGFNSIASAGTSTAMGYISTASGYHSTAMGVHANTNTHTNSFCIAGAPGDLAAVNTADNQMMMRFDNYTFWVSSANFAYLVPASNGWAYTSDVNKKERFEELNGETVLQKISKIPSYSWNFKASDTRQYRHYGIMAQDFYNSFGKDSYGVIGNDTTISPLDLLGVAYSGIKALEKRSTVLSKENEQLKADNYDLQKEVAELNKQTAKTNALLADKIGLLEMKIDEMMAAKEKENAKIKIVVTNK